MSDTDVRSASLKTCGENAEKIVEKWWGWPYRDCPGSITSYIPHTYQLVELDDGYDGIRPKAGELLKQVNLTIAPQLL